MEVVNRVSKMKTVAQELTRQRKKIGFVPTMGAIHEGHLSLVRRARAMSDSVLVSILVNPLQFGKNEDYSQYPRNLAQDVGLLAQENVDFIFTPPVEEMYPAGFSTYVQVKGLSRRLCGISRPGHFRGVTTVVLGLFNITKPTFAFFGQKDAQQLIIIKRMVKDLQLDLEIVGCPTVREADGLALSSRNSYLTAEQRKAAVVIYKALSCAKQKIMNQGERKSKKLIHEMTEFISREPAAQIDYISIVDLETLLPVKRIEKEALLAAAVYIAKTRLIDNVLINLSNHADN